MSTFSPLSKAEAEVLIFWHEAVLEYVKKDLIAMGIVSWKAQDDAVRTIIPLIDGDKETKIAIMKSYLARRSQ